MIGLNEAHVISEEDWKLPRWRDQFVLQVIKIYYRLIWANFLGHFLGNFLGHLFDTFLGHICVTLEASPSERPVFPSAF